MALGEKSFADACVLIVDDAEFALSLLKKVLEQFGITNVLTANDGEAAIEVLRSTDQNVNLIISDIEMPNMDGYIFVRKVRYGIVPRFRDVPIILLTGKEAEKNEKKARMYKIDGFVVKPPKPENLMGHLVSLLG